MVNCDSIRMKHPFRCVVSGPSGSGKTQLTRNIIAKFQELTTIAKPYVHVLWCHGQDQHIHNIEISPFVKVKYSGVLPSNEEIVAFKTDILVIDDLMTELGDSKRLAAIYTKLSHHLNFSVFFLVQNFFHKSKQMRTITINSQFIIFMKNRRDLLQIEYFGRQIFPRDLKAFMKVYNDATQSKYGYLLIDLHPETPEECRLRSRLLEEEKWIWSKDEA